MSSKKYLEYANTKIQSIPLVHFKFSKFLLLLLPTTFCGPMPVNNLDYIIYYNSYALPCWKPSTSPVSLNGSIFVFSLYAYVSFWASVVGSSSKAIKSLRIPTRQLLLLSPFYYPRDIKLMYWFTSIIHRDNES